MAVILNKSKTLSVFSLVMINIIAVDSLRTLPFGAELGLSVVFYYLLAAIVFFVPVALVAAELATGWPETGGLYVWVKQAFGARVGFITIWLQWVYNIVWYPTILVFIITTLASLYAPQMVNNSHQLWLAINGVFWLVTLLNCLGMRVASWVSIFGAVVGTLIPMLFIMGLAVAWVWQGHPVQLTLSWAKLVPDFRHLNHFLMFSIILFGLVGMEMSAVHAGDVKNPKRDYPRALLISTVVIFITLMCSSLAIALVVPQHKLALASGLIDAFRIFFDAYGMGFMAPIIAWMIAIGAASSVAAWVLGPSKGMMVAAEDGNIPRHLRQTNRFGAPMALLLVQGLIFSLLSLLFVFMDNINATYWLLSALTAQMALMVYVFMFLAAIKLRITDGDVARSYRIPGPNWVLNGVACLGLVTCLFAIGLGFIPPDEVAVSKQFSVLFYESFLCGGILFFVLLPWLYSGMKSIDDESCLAKKMLD